MTDLAQVAVYMARRGWAVYPQAPNTNTPRANCATCKEGGCEWRSGKCPCLVSVTSPCHALHAATTDVDLTAARWEHAPRCNPALHLGRSRLVVIDIDCHADTAPDELAPGLPNPGITNGLGSFAALLDHLGQDWPEDTLTVESPTGGVHMYFQAPRVPLRTTHAAWQVEVKAGASSITAPGSLRRLDDGTTGTYRRVSETTEPAPFPRWLGEWLVSTGRIADPTRPATPTVMPGHGRNGGRSRRWWEKAWTDQLGEIANAAPGTRNDVVLRRGLRLFNLTDEPGCPWTAQEAEDALVAAQEQYAINTGRPSNPSEYRAVARATRARARTSRGEAA